MSTRLFRAIALALGLSSVVSLAGCHGKSVYDNGFHVVFYEPTESVLPSGFHRYADAGNGWYVYSSPVGFWMVSVQEGYAYDQVELSYIGRSIDAQ
jgi:hypothetical protein